MRQASYAVEPARGDHRVCTGAEGRERVAQQVVGGDGAREVDRGGQEDLLRPGAHCRHRGSKADHHLDARSLSRGGLGRPCRP